MSYKLGGVVWTDIGTMETKELSPLEAWEEIKRQIGSATYIRSDLGAPQITTMLVKDTGLFEIIDRAIKRLEFLETSDNVFTFFFGGREAGKTAINMLICNRLKALEIIFKKEVNIYSLKRYLFRRETSVHVVPYIESLLTKEEIEIMRKAFCDDSGTFKIEAR